jgi:hypothetical protein
MLRNSKKLNWEVPFICKPIKPEPTPAQGPSLSGSQLLGLFSIALITLGKVTHTTDSGYNAEPTEIIQTINPKLTYPSCGFLLLVTLLEALVCFFTFASSAF